VSRNTRGISWIKAARKTFEKFSADAQLDIQRALTVAAEGRKADIAKPLRGLGPGIYEIALRFRTEAFRTVYAVNIGEDVWGVHAFQKKSRTGLKTPQHEIDVIRERIKRLKEMLTGEKILNSRLAAPTCSVTLDTPTPMSSKPRLFSRPRLSVCSMTLSFRPGRPSR
jgi:phage-related protein